MSQDKRWTLVVHGGAGAIAKGTPKRSILYRNALDEIVKAASALLDQGATALDVVEFAVKLFEDSPLFNAGVGAVFTHEEEHELDASIMDGTNRKAGVVCGVKTIRYPIAAARAVMEKSEHVMLNGSGAEQFAKEQELEIVENSFFSTDERLQALRRIKHHTKFELDHSGASALQQTLAASESESKISIPAESKETATNSADPACTAKTHKYGTVGAVARDVHGNIAAATSTGGMTNKRWGRLGDSAVIGAGTYADNRTCAVSCTGWGEYFIRGVVAYDVSACMEYAKLPLDKAAELVKSKFASLGPDFTGGFIAVDAEGNFAMPFNSPGMYRGYAQSDGTRHVAIWKDGDDEDVAL